MKRRGFLGLLLGVVPGVAVLRSLPKPAPRGPRNVGYYLSQHPEKLTAEVWAAEMRSVVYEQQRIVPLLDR